MPVILKKIRWALCKHQYDEFNIFVDLRTEAHTCRVEMKCLKCGLTNVYITRNVYWNWR